MKTTKLQQRYLALLQLTIFKRKQILSIILILGFLSLFNTSLLAQCANQGTGANQDFDCDGVINSADLDDDNDGILDTEECLIYKITWDNSAEGWIFDDINGSGGNLIGETCTSCGSTAYDFGHSIDPATATVQCPIPVPAPPSGTPFIGGIDRSGLWSHYKSPLGLNLDLSALQNGSMSWYWYNESQTGLGQFQNNIQVYLISGNDYVEATVDVTGLAGNGVWNLLTVDLINSNWTGTTTLAAVLSDVDRIRIEVESLNSSDGSCGSFPEIHYIDDLVFVGPPCSASLDTDSDNDGCSDAVEGGASFTNSNTDANDMLTGGVDGNGVPLVAGASGQTIGSSQNAFTQDANCVCSDPNLYASNCDFDGDGELNIDDLDDDNDGILDVVEYGNCGNLSDPELENPATPNTYGNDAFFTAFNSGTNWSQLLGSPGYHHNTINPGGIPISNKLATPNGVAYAGFHSIHSGPQEVIMNNLVSNLLIGQEYSISFITYKMLISIFNQSGTFYVYGIRKGTNPSITSSNTSTAISIVNITNVDLLGTSPLIDNENTWETINIQVNPTYEYDRILFAIQGTDSYLALDDIQVKCGTDDYDSDGIPNHFDTDSDDDGCSDGIEGGASFTASNTDANDMLTGGVDGNGVPLVAGANGQAIGDSQNATTQSPNCCTSVAPTLSGN